MENGNRIIKRIICVILSLTLFTCMFSSCGSKDDVDDITRGSEKIERPTAAQTQPEGEVTTDPDATKVYTTKPNNSTSTTAASSGSSEVPVTLKDQQANEAINQAASSSGANASDLAEFVQVMGYDYDPNQGIFYTSLDNWQRQGNFVAHYDTAASYFNMYYRTVRIDFTGFDEYDWRIQLWKGQYGVFGGCEIGVYTKDPVENEMLYHCVDNDHLLYMESALYLNKSDYQNHKIMFTREWQAHWWLTGFKAGVVDPTKLVMTMRIRMRSNTMATKFEEGLKQAGFTQGDATTQYNTYRRSLNDIYILWDDLGEMNYIQKRS